jgi:histidinol-phosphatase
VAEFRAPLATLLEFALELARAAEAPILDRYRRAAVSFKADGSEVTDADRRAEEVMRRLITRRYPDHAILGEEFGASGSPDATWQWLLDPVDGTASFSLGIPLFGTLVGLLYHRRPVVGVIHLPAIGETVYAAHGGGCWSQVGSHRPIQVRVAAASSLEDAIVLAPAGVGSGAPAQREAVFRSLLPLLGRARKVRFGGDCLQHALVCRGVAHVAVDPVMHPWDIAAIAPCVEEAGGVVSTLSGVCEDVAFGGSLVSSCHEMLRREVCELLACA